MPACGYYNHPSKECICSQAAVQRYLNRISGPLLDRIDLQIEIYPVAFDELSSAREGEKSEAMKSRVVRAREIQALRFASERGIHCNAQMSSRLLRNYASIDRKGLETLREAMTRLDMSARGRMTVSLK